MLDVEWEEECLLEERPDPELEREIRRIRGILPPGTRYLTPRPWILRAVGYLDSNNGLLVDTDLNLARLIRLAVSQENSCRFCYASHRAALRFGGMSESRIRKLEQDLFAAELEPGQRSALQFARRVARSNPLPTEVDKKPLRDAGYSEEAIVEVAFLAAVEGAINRVSTLPALPLEELEIFSRFYVRWAAPLLGRFLRRHVRRGVRLELAEERIRGPYSDFVRALAPLPLASALRRLLDSALDPTVLPLRTKALAFAVVARGLGCERSELEAKRLLDEQGMPEAQVDAVLRHLGAADLDPVDAQVAEMARESIWYQAGAIQRRGRQALEVLGNDRFLELVGVLAAANFVCRLGIVADANG